MVTYYIVLVFGCLYILSPLVVMLIDDLRGEAI